MNKFTHFVWGVTSKYALSFSECVFAFKFKSNYFKLNSLSDVLEHQIWLNLIYPLIILSLLFIFQQNTKSWMIMRRLVLIRNSTHGWGYASLLTSMLLSRLMAFLIRICQSIIQMITGLTQYVILSLCCHTLVPLRWVYISHYCLIFFFPFSLLLYSIFCVRRSRIHYWLSKNYNLLDICSLSTYNLA